MYSAAIFIAFSGTIFEASKLPLTSWFLAVQLLTQPKNNVSALELKRHLGVCCSTAWLVKHKTLEGMRLAADDRPFTGRVEIDDAFLSAGRSGGKAGRGSENKVQFVNASGLPTFYGANLPETAIAEVRPPVGSWVVVARFAMLVL